MSSRFVQFIAFRKVQNNLLRVLQTIFEIDEMEHEVADRVEDDVLSQNFWDSHRLILLAFIPAVTSVRFISAPQRPFDRLSKIIEVAHQIACRFHELLLVFLNSVIILNPTSIFFLLYGLLEFLVKNFLQDTFPDVLFLPDSMIVYKFGQVLFLESFAVFSRHFGCFERILFLEVYELTRIEDRVNDFEIDIFFVNNGCEEILDEFAQRL